MTSSSARPRDAALAAFLTVQSVTMAGVGVCYVSLSARGVTGTTARYLFGLIPQAAWGVAFLVVAAVALVAAFDLRRWGLAGVVLITSQGAWVGTLATQLALVHHAPIIAPLVVWSGVLATNLVIFGLLVPRGRQWPR